MSERAWNRKDRGLARRGEDGRSEGKDWKRRRPRCARRRGQKGRGKDKSGTASSHRRTEERESAEEKDAGGLHASLEPSSGAVAFKYSLRPFCLQLSHTVTFPY